MLTLSEVEYGIRHYATVELGGELSFPFGMPYEQAAERLRMIANQTGGYVYRGKHLGQPWLIIYPHGEAGHWRLIWRDYHLEIVRFMPESRTFRYPAAAAPAT